MFGAKGSMHPDEILLIFTELQKSIHSLIHSSISLEKYYKHKHFLLELNLLFLSMNRDMAILEKNLSSRIPPQ